MNSLAIILTILVALGFSGAAHAEDRYWRQTEPKTRFSATPYGATYEYVSPRLKPGEKSEISFAFTGAVARAIDKVRREKSDVSYLEFSQAIHSQKTAFTDPKFVDAMSRAVACAEAAPQKKKTMLNSILNAKDVAYGKCLFDRLPVDRDYVAIETAFQAPFTTLKTWPIFYSQSKKLLENLARFENGTLFYNQGIVGFHACYRGRNGLNDKANELFIYRDSHLDPDIIFCNGNGIEVTRTIITMSRSDFVNRLRNGYLAVGQHYSNIQGKKEFIFIHLFDVYEQAMRR